MLSPPPPPPSRNERTRYLDLLQTLLSLVPWAGRKQWGGEGGQQSCLGLNTRSNLKGEREEGRGMQTNPRLTLFLSSSQPQPSGSKEPGTVATDPESWWCSRNTERLRKGEQVLISPSPFF